MKLFFHLSTHNLTKWIIVLLIHIQRMLHHLKIKFQALDSKGYLCAGNMYENFFNIVRSSNFTKLPWMTAFLVHSSNLKKKLP